MISLLLLVGYGLLVWAVAAPAPPLHRLYLRLTITLKGWARK